MIKGRSGPVSPSALLISLHLDSFLHQINNGPHFSQWPLKTDLSAHWRKVGDRESEGEGGREGKGRGRNPGREGKRKNDREPGGGETRGRKEEAEEKKREMTIEIQRVSGKRSG